MASGRRSTPRMARRDSARTAIRNGFSRPSCTSSCISNTTSSWISRARVEKEGEMTRRLPLLVAVVVVLAALVHAQESWRPTIVAQHGMVASGHPLASEAGMRILKAGGNAIDAAIATWAVQGQVEPGMTGLGADM